MKRIKEKEIARNLRRDNGFSISEIEKKINVPYTTIKRWIKDIPLTKEQDIQLAIRNPNYKKSENASKIYSETYRSRRSEFQKNGRDIAKNCKFSLWVAGAMLYWGEGGKSCRDLVSFSNSDPYMIQLFLRFVREELKIEDAKIKISIHCYNDIHSVEEIEKYWLDISGLLKNNLNKTIVNKYPTSSKKTKIGKSEYGTCTIRFGSVESVQKIFGFIKEIANINSDIWLD